MTYEEIKYFEKVNDTEECKVKEIAASIKGKGFVGCPILVYGNILITGSHRLDALKMLEEEGEDVSDMEVAEDVTSLVDSAIHAFEESNGWVPDVDFRNIGWLFKGSWVEKYKDEIVEW